MVDEEGIVAIAGVFDEPVLVEEAIQMRLVSDDGGTIASLVTREINGFQGWPVKEGIGLAALD